MTGMTDCVNCGGEHGEMPRAEAVAEMAKLWAEGSHYFVPLCGKRFLAGAWPLRGVADRVYVDSLGSTVMKATREAVLLTVSSLVAMVDVQDYEMVVGVYTIPVDIDPQLLRKAFRGTSISDGDVPVNSGVRIIMTVRKDTSTQEMPNLMVDVMREAEPVLAAQLSEWMI